MLIESVDVNIKKFFMEGPHLTVPSVKMFDALASYKSKYKF